MAQPIQTAAYWDETADAYIVGAEPFTAQFCRDAVALAEIETGMSLLDIATGPGALALAAAAEGAHQDFIQRFQKNAIPDDMPELEIALSDEGIAIGNLLKEANLVGSTSDAMRMIKQGAVKINGDKVEDTRLVITEKGENVYQVGKRKFARITLA